MKKSHCSASTLLCLSLILVTSFHAVGGEPAAKLDPHVQAILQKTADFYKGLTSFEVDVKHATHVETFGMNNDITGNFHVAMQRPASFSMVMSDGMTGGTLVSDGKTLVEYVPILGKYTSNEAPDTVDGVTTPINLALAEGGFPMGFEVFLRKDPVGHLGGDIVTSKVVGSEKVGESAATHLQITSSDFTLDYWIADGATPLILKEMATPTDSVLNQAAKLTGKTLIHQMKIVGNSTFSNWVLNQPVAAALFQFTPPSSAQLVDDFVPQPTSPLVGKSAPDFELKDLDGKTVKLSDLRGKIVVLDFWATWCAPCIATLPVVSEVTADRKDKGVVFYAANQKEKPDTISSFFKKHGLNPAVLLDSEGTVSDLFKADSIPVTVVIGKDGIIQAVHTGYSPAMKRQLSHQLDELITGKTLVQK